MIYDTWVCLKMGDDLLSNLAMSLAKHDEAMWQAESIPWSHQSYCEALQAGLQTLVLGYPCKHMSHGQNG